MVVTTSLSGFIAKASSAFSRIVRPRLAWTSVTMAIFALLACAYVNPTPASAVAGINRQINFQGRLLNSQGATVADGYYNIQFKIYQDGAGTAVGNPGGTLMWTESHLNNNSQGVVVKNGFMSVQLGSINAFGSQIDWNQDTIWLSMNIGNTNATCTPFASCAPDGEMVPMKRMTATPYALNSGMLNGLASSNFVQLAQGVQTDATVGQSSIFINKTVAGNLLQLQSSGADAFTVSNAGDLVFGAAANHTISIATAAAATAGKTLTMSAGAGGSGAGSAGGDLVLAAGAAGGTDGNGGNVTINAGAKTGTGANGTLSLGTANTSGITLGASTTISAGQSLTLVGGATGTRPASPTEGMIYFDTTTKQLLTFANGKWQADRTEAVIVAASDSSQADKDAADYLANGNTGAAADGDQVQINQALTAGAGKKVVLLAGTYTVDATVLVPNNTTLTGVGRGTLVEFADIDTGDNLIENSDTTTGTGVVIRDLRLDGRSDLNTGSQNGIVFAGMGSGTGASARAGGKVQNTHIYRFSGTAAFISSGSLNDFSDNTIINSGGYAVTLGTTASNTTVTHNAITGNAAGINSLGSSNVISHNTITDSAATGLKIEGDNVIAESNKINGSTTGINVLDGTRAMIRNNIVSAATTHGITTNASEGVIEGNTIENSGGSTTNNAIYLDAALSTRVSENTIYDSSASSNNYSINIVSGSSAITLVDNSLGGGSVSDNGTGTKYEGQNSGSSYVVQPADDFTITGNGASTVSTTAGNLTLQAGSGTVSLGSSTTLSANGALTVGSGAGTALTLTSNAAATWSTSAGALTLTSAAATTWSTTSGNLTIDAGATLELGTVNATGLSLSKAGATTTVNGALTIATGQNFTVNGDTFTDLTGSGLTVSGNALTVDASSATGFYRNGGNSFGTGATLGTNDNNNLALRTNGTTRATFDTSNNLYLGNGTSSPTPSNFVVQGTTSSASGVTGGNLTVQGGGANTGNANGGNLTLSGGTGIGTGANGLVLITTPTFSTTSNDANCYTGGARVAASCTITAASVNSSAAIIVGFTTDAQTATLPDPAITTAGRIVYITASDLSKDFTLAVNGGVGIGNLIAMRANTSATMVWNGTDWTAAGASSSTTLQSAYDNTLQSSGGAELIVSKTGSTNGLTIRDSATNPVNGAVLSIQSSSAAGLLSVNSNLTEYASNAGAETKGASDTAFPASTWDKQGNAGVSVTRNITTNNNSIATGQASVSVTTTANVDDGVKNTIAQLTPNQTYNVSFTAILSSGTFTDMSVHYSRDGTTASLTNCKAGQAIATRVWTKVNCTFTAPASGINSSNAIFIRQATGTTRTFYVDNLSVTLAADKSYATDGSVDDAANFGTNWPAIASATVTRDTGVGNDASSSAKVVANTAGQGVKNKLVVNPIPDKLYRITAYVYATAAFSTLQVQYSYNDSTTTNCDDYNSTTASTDPAAFRKITCYIKTPASTATNPYIYFKQTDSSAHTWHVDTFSMTLAESTTPNVQVGGGINGGPTTLFTLDKGASAPIAGDNEALLGSMYYDTTLGKLQCYEADGWGACGSSPDVIVTLSPEFANAVMHGTGVGTLTSDLCSDYLDINDLTNGPAICGTNETYNFYKWTSPQASAQAYSIYVTYQLPSTFKAFASGSTAVKGRTDNGSQGGAASLKYTVFKNIANNGGMTACNATAVTVSSGTQTSWQPGIATGTADPSTCGFAAGDSIVFKIEMSSSKNAVAYLTNLNFTFSNK